MGDGVVRDRSVYQFHDVRVDLGRMAALRGDSAIPLEPKAFDVLVYLIEHRDRVVTKDELLDAVWTGTFVTPNVLSRAVAQIRKALGDESQDGPLHRNRGETGLPVHRPVTIVAPVGESAVRPPSSWLEASGSRAQTGRVVAPGKLWSCPRCSRSPRWRWPSSCSGSVRPPRIPTPPTCG